MSNANDSYFAQAKKENIGQELTKKLEGSFDNGDRQKLFDTAYKHYYGYDGSTSEIVRGGDQGELSEIRVNKARSNAKSLLSILLGPKLNWRPQAPNSDPSARAATILATNLLEFQWKRRWLSRFVARWVEQSIIFSESFIFDEWDLAAGPPLAPDAKNKTILRQGDITYHNVPPWRVTRDSDCKSYEDLEWWIVTLHKNKWNQAALFEKDVLGELAKPKILAAASNDKMLKLGRIADPSRSSDLVPVHYFFHKPSPVLPAGREAVFLSPDCVLKDTPLTYDTIPVHRLASDELFDTPFAYTSWWDGLSIQELMDGIETALATNLLTLATQSVAIEQGTETPPDHAHGMKAFYYTKGGRPPEGINMSKSPPEAFAHLKQKASDQQQLLGLNDVYRGQPDTAQMNAQAFALLASQAITQNSPAQAAVVDAVAQLGTSVLQTLCKRVKNERKIAITGKASQYLYAEKSFKGSELKPIQGVLIDIGNPIEQTAAGRFELAKMHKELGLIKTPEELQQVVDTGRMEPATQSLRDELMLVACENEQLAAGENPPVHTFQDHLIHFKENASVLSNPESLKNVRVIEAVAAHCDAHYREYWGLPEGVEPKTDPQYLVRIRMMLGQVPPPMEVPMPMGPPPPGGEGDAGDPGAMMSEPAPAGPDVKLPKPPANPLTGQPYAGANGAGAM